MSVYILDSNIVSFYIRQDQRVIQKVKDTLFEGHEVIISPIAYYEVKRGLQAIKAHGFLLYKLSIACANCSIFLS